MDPAMIAGMIFSLIVLILVGGFVLLYPLTRRLAERMEQRMIEGGDARVPDDVLALRRAVDELRDEVERIAERQDFTERLLEKPRPGAGEGP